MEQRLVVLLEVIKKNQPITRSNIQSIMSEYYPRTREDDNKDSGMRKITKDIQTLNSKLESGVLIKGTSEGYHIITKESYADDMENELINILKRLKRHYKKVKKAGLDKQIDINGMIHEIFN